MIVVDATDNVGVNFPYWNKKIEKSCPWKITIIVFMLMPLPGRKQWKHWTRRGGCIPETSSGDFFSFFVFLPGGFSLLFFGQVDFSLLFVRFLCAILCFWYQGGQWRLFHNGELRVIQIIKFYRFCHLLHTCRIDLSLDDKDDNDDGDNLGAGVDDVDQVGRIKEIIIPAGGENVAPVNIEEEIKSELQEVPPHSSQSCCHF